MKSTKLSLNKKATHVWHKTTMSNVSIIIVMVFTPFTAASQSWKYSSELDHRIEKVLNFNFSNANYELSTDIINITSPLDILPTSNQILLKTLFYTHTERYLAEYEANMKLLEVLGKFENKSAEWGFVKTRLLLNKTIIHFFRDEYFSALWSAFQANSIFSETLNKYPNYPPLHALAILYNFGINSAIENNSIIEYFVQKPYTVNYELLKTDWSESEKPILSTLAQILINTDSTNITKIKPKTETEKTICALYYLSSGHSHKALNITNDNLSKTNPLINYINGWANLTLGYYELAEQQFINHIKNNENIAFKRASLIGIYYIEIINNANPSPSIYLNKLNQMPNSNIFRDKMAEREIKTIHHPKLLKARLFFDAKQYKKADDELKSINVIELSPEFKLEYYYRYGRILFQLQEYDKSLKKYLKALESEMPDKSYYKAQAALDCGKIYMIKNDKIKARNYFNKCIQFAKTNNRNDIENQVNSALREIK